MEKSLSDIEPITSRLAFLQEVIAAPAEYLADQTLLAALTSQGAFAQYSTTDSRLQATSLNTLKRHAERCLPGGFEALDAKRHLALDLLDAAKKNQSPRTAKRSKMHLQMRIHELDRRDAQAIADKKLLTAALGDAIAKMRAYAKDSKDPAIIARCNKDIWDLLHRFSLSSQSVVIPELTAE